MPGKPDIQMQSTNYSQPWWLGVGESACYGDSTTKSSSTEHLNGSVMNDGRGSEANEGLSDGIGFNKQTQTQLMASQPGSGGCLLFWHLFRILQKVIFFFNIIF